MFLVTIVHNCKNTKDQGVFIGDICKPCYEFLINPTSTIQTQLIILKNLFTEGENKMKDIEDYIDKKFQFVLNKRIVIENFLARNKKLIDSLHSQILKNIENGNLQFTIDLNAMTDMNIVNIIINKMNNNGWRCIYNSGDYRTEPSIKFTFIELNTIDANDYYNK